LIAPAAVPIQIVIEVSIPDVFDAVLEPRPRPFGRSSVGPARNGTQQPGIGEFTRRRARVMFSLSPHAGGRGLPAQACRSSLRWM
jgi:hypothetical protein